MVNSSGAIDFNCLNEILSLISTKYWVYHRDKLFRSKIMSIFLINVGSIFSFFFLIPVNLVSAVIQVLS